MTMKIKNIPFVGGNTMEFEFDFGTKVYDSMAECPLNMYYCIMNSIQPPTNISASDSGSGFRKIAAGYNSQSLLDKIKSLDGTFINPYATNGGIMQVMIELDLTQLCTSLFGGATSAMKTAMKSKTFAAYARGSGVSSSTQVYSCDTYIWSNVGSQWNKLNTNSTSSIAEMMYTEPGGGDNRINSSNKMYFLICTTYPSDGTIPSEVDLDYVNIKLQFSRVPDVVSSIPITLPDTWSMLIKGFSPAYSSNDTLSMDKVLLDIGDGTGNNRLGLSLNSSSKKMQFFKYLGSNITNASIWAVSNPMTFNKFQTYNILIEQTSNGLRMRMLKNGGTVEKYLSTINSSSLKGNLNMFLGQGFTNTNQADVFLNSLVFLPNKVFDDDSEAESILRGTAQGFENDELFDINKVSLNPNAHIENNSIILNATGQWQGSFISIPVLPNNQYEFKCDITSSSPTHGYAEVTCMYNSIKLFMPYTAIGISTSSNAAIFTTSEHCNNVYLYFGNDINTAGTLTFSNISLKLKM